MNKSQREQALQTGLQLLAPLLYTARNPVAAANQANRVQEHYRKALEPRICPVCQDSACETKDETCGT